MGKDEETASCARKKAAVIFGENHILKNGKINHGKTRNFTEQFEDVWYIILRSYGGRRGPAGTGCEHSPHNVSNSGVNK